MADGLSFARITRGNGGFVFLTGSTGNTVVRNGCLASPSSPYTARGIVLISMATGHPFYLAQRVHEDKWLKIVGVAYSDFSQSGEPLSAQGELLI
ncbi:hypothetical protein QQF64_013893 [Cirrhinus molitorella]|uniref:Uncharacterized protein n=1 Tax=Cirrhinus molitorella TaxID=172907 RepID=A0ABR3LSE6_9TELE